MCLRVIVALQILIVQSFFALYRKDSLACCREDLLCVKITADSFFQAKALQSGCCKNKGRILSGV